MPRVKKRFWRVGRIAPGLAPRRIDLVFVVRSRTPKELSYTLARYGYFPLGGFLHEAEQDPRPPGLRLHVDRPRDDGARRHDRGRAREDEEPRGPRAPCPRTEEARRSRDAPRADAAQEPASGDEGLDGPPGAAGGYA